MIYILIIYGIISLISYVATAAILEKFEKGGVKNEREMKTVSRWLSRIFKEEGE